MPRQELVDAQAGADLAHRRAETYAREAKTDRESRRENAEISLLEMQTQKLAGEVAQQSLEAEERRARIEESEARTVRIWVLTLLPPLLVAVALITGTLNAAHLSGSDLEIISQKFFWLPKLAAGG